MPFQTGLWGRRRRNRPVDGIEGPNSLAWSAVIDRYARTKLRAAHRDAEGQVHHRRTAGAFGELHFASQLLNPWHHSLELSWPRDWAVQARRLHKCRGISSLKQLLSFNHGEAHPESRRLRVRHRRLTNAGKLHALLLPRQLCLRQQAGVNLGCNAVRTLRHSHLVSHRFLCQAPVQTQKVL